MKMKFDYVRRWWVGERGEAWRYHCPKNKQQARAPPTAAMKIGMRSRISAATDGSEVVLS